MMQPLSGSKRILDAVENNRQSPPPKKRVILPPPQPNSCFEELPYELITHIFSRLPVADLMSFESACKAHQDSRMTDQAWSFFRARDQFHPNYDWLVCKGNNRSNYLLSKAIVSYIQALPNSQFEPKQKVLVKMQRIREKFSPFEALVQLTLVPKKQQGIPDAVAIELKKEPLLEMISDIYEFARRVYQMEREGGKRKTTKKQQQAVQNAVRESVNSMEPKIRDWIAKNDVTYISALAVAIFARYRLITGNKKDFLPFLTKLTLQSKLRGDTRGFNALLKEMYKNNCDNNFFDHITTFGDVELDSELQKYKLISQFTSSRGQNRESLWPQVRELLDDPNFSLPFPNLYRIVEWCMDKQEWLKADRYLALMLEKETPLSTYTLEAAALVKEQMGQLEEADTLYNIILDDKKLKQPCSKSMNVQFEHYWHRYNQNFLNILLRALAVKVRLGRFQEADRYVNELFKKDRGGLSQRLSKEHFLMKIVDLERSEFLSHLLLDCCKVKEGIGDKVGCMWFKSLWQLAQVDEEDMEACLKLEPDLMKTFYEIGNTYQYPRCLAFTAGNIQLKLQKVSEAEWCYDKCLPIYDPKWKDQVLYVAWLKWELHKWEDAAKWYELAWNIGVFLSPSERQFVLENLISIYVYCRQWNHALEVFERAKRFYGNNIPNAIIQFASMIEG